MPAPRPPLAHGLDLTSCCSPLIAEVPDEQESAALAAGFRALGDPVRLQMLGMLLNAPDGEVCACDLVVPLARSQSTVSHHLKVLRLAGLVASRRQGANILYSARRDQIAALQAFLAPSVVPAAAEADHHVSRLRSQSET
jgi:ArsR family transcriptional regulator